MKALERDVLAVAEALATHGLFRTALRLLDGRPDLYGQRANALRRHVVRNALAHPIRAGQYVLTVLADTGAGCVVPVRAERGSRRAGLWEGPGGISEAALLRVQEAAKQALTPSGNLPALRLIVPEALSFFGDSAGLPAALACVEKWCGMPARTPVLATGELGFGGRVLAVRNLKEKLEAASAELEAACGGMALIPSAQAREAAGFRGDRVLPVGTLEDAVKAVWSECPVRADAGLLSLEDVLKEAEGEPDHRRALEVLESHASTCLAPADKARLLFAQGCRWRHLGLSERAAELHERARRLFPGNEGAIGKQAVETLEMECFASAMDLYALEGLAKDLRLRLEGKFLADHNRVRCQGMLAQLASTLGNHEEAVLLRQSNLRIQTASEAMRNEIPRTLACLAYEAARGGMYELFDETAWRLFLITEPADERQTKYNVSSVGRGLVLLGRYGDLLNWAHGRKRLFGRGPERSLGRLLEGGPARIEAAHPEVSTLRALVRALRHAGEATTAAEAAARLEPGAIREGDLVRWLAGLVEVERALALRDAGRSRLASSLLSSAAVALEACHAPAARFHSALVESVKEARLDEAGVKRIETELDRVYY